MATTAQINAARENSKKSTGPKTAAGKSKSSRNATKLGLFAAHDFILPDDQPAYDEMCAAFWQDLSPQGPVEEALTLQVIRASWRLERCAKVEWTMAERNVARSRKSFSNWKSGHSLQTPYGPQDPLASEDGRDETAALDRARTSAQNSIRRALTDLRRIQTERAIARQNEVPTRGIADPRPVLAARKAERNTPPKTAPARSIKPPNAPEPQPLNVSEIELEFLTKRTPAPQPQPPTTPSRSPTSLTPPENQST